MNSNICIKNIIRMLIVLTFLVALAPQKTTLAEDNLPAFEDYVFYSSWGGDGKQILEPADVAIGDNGKVYIANTKLNRITMIDPDGYIYNEIGGVGSGDGSFNYISSVAVNAAGEIYVADAWNHNIQKFDASGNHLLTWGGYGSEVGRLNGPSGLALDSEGNVYVADSGNDRIQKFTADGIFLRALGSQGIYNNQFYSPRDIAINSIGEIFVADTFNSRIQRFTANWEHILTIQIKDSIYGETILKPFGITIDQENQLIVTTPYKIHVLASDGALIREWGDFGRSDGEFYNASGIDVDDQGTIYVADQNNDRIQKFDLDGNYLNTIGVKQKAPGYFNSPNGITIINDYIYVSDGGNNRIQKFNQHGTFLLDWGNYGMESGQFNNPGSMAGDSFGNVYVVDSWNHRIQKFDSNGTFLSSWGGNGTEMGSFKIPRGIAIDQQDNIFIVDSDNHRIQKFNSNQEFIETWGSIGSGEGQFSNPSGIAVDSSGNVYVADTYNNRVQKFTNDGEFITQWAFNRDPNSPLYYANPWEIEVDSNDFVYVTGVYVPDIQKFTNGGEFLGSFGQRGYGAGELGSRPDLAVSQTGVIYVSDWSNKRVQMISPFQKEVDPNFGLIQNGGFESVPALKSGVDMNRVWTSDDLATPFGISTFEIPELNHWTYGGSLPISISENAQQGNYALLLGEPVDPVAQGVGDAWAYQVVYIRPEWFYPVLSFKYNVVANDSINSSNFLVEIQDGVGLNHLATVVKDGIEPETKQAYPDVGFDAGWKTITYDLSAFRGQTVRLLFSNRNELPDSTGIWTYLDDVKLTDETERVFLPLIHR